MKAYTHVILAFFLAGTATALVRGQEVTYPADAFKQLDTFEAHMLGNADKFFLDKNYRRAQAEYESFILEFPRSAAVPYAILRKGRTLELDNKRFEAIRAYQEVLDYFPDDVRYAAAALFHMGQCHQENGDLEQAIRSWIAIADDVEYSKHHLAAPALLRIAENFEKQERFDAAVRYYEQVAENFRTTAGGNEAFHALNKALGYRVREKPDAAGLRNLYLKARGFDRRPGNVGNADIEADTAYWHAVRAQVRRFGDFDQFRREQAQAYYRYWHNAMRGRFPDDDDYQVDLARFLRQAQPDSDAWITMLDQQYRRDPSRGGYHARLIRWIQLLADNKGKVAEYIARCRPQEMSAAEMQELVRVLYADVKSPELAAEFFPRIAFAELSQQQIESLLHFLYDTAKDNAMARFVAEKIRYADMSDQDMARLARSLWAKDERVVLEICARMGDQTLADANRLRYYHWARNAGSGIPLAQKLTEAPDYASEAWWILGEFHQWARRWEEAIAAYRQTERQPDSLWRIADCYMELGNTANAVAQLKEVENFFENVRSVAAMRIVACYRRAGMQAQQIAALRHVMNKYPESAESRHAHVELQQLGVERVGGGVDAD